MAESESWFFEERAEQLAMVYLSRRDDLMISGTDYGVDLLVSLTRNGSYTGRVFGVQVKALKSYPQAERLSLVPSEIRFDLRETAALSDLPLPLCLFIFVMEDDAGYYKWIKKPAYGLDGRSQLLQDQTSDLKKLDDGAIDRIVSQAHHLFGICDLQRAQEERID